MNPGHVTATLQNERQRRADSFVNGYMPPDELVIDPSLKLHTEYDSDVDPISYEVLRSKLWNVNWDHQETIRRVSGSQVVVYGYDFNTCDPDRGGRRRLLRSRATCSSAAAPTSWSSGRSSTGR